MSRDDESPFSGPRLAAALLLWRCSKQTANATIISAKDKTYAAMSKRPLIDVDAFATPLASRKIPANSRHVEELRKCDIDSPIWTDETTTCLSLGLCPIHPDHQPLVCKNCIYFWEKKLKFGKLKHDSAKRSRRSTCDRPFAFRGRAEVGKQHAHERIRELLSASDPSDDQSAEIVEVHCPSPVPKRNKTSLSAYTSSTPSATKKRRVVLQKCVMKTGACLRH